MAGTGPGNPGYKGPTWRELVSASTTPRPKPAKEVNMWEVGDRAESSVFGGPRYAGEIAAIAPDGSACLRTDSGTLELTHVENLTRPAPRKRTVVVHEYKSGAITTWGINLTVLIEEGDWEPTGRTHTFQIEEDADG